MYILYTYIYILYRHYILTRCITHGVCARAFAYKAAIIFIVNLTLNIRSCPILDLIIRTLRNDRAIFSVKWAEEQSVYYNYGVCMEAIVIYFHE